MPSSYAELTCDLLVPLVFNRLLNESQMLPSALAGLCRDRNHSEAAILAALQGQALRWLMSWQLEPGMGVCDNSTNFLVAIRQGKLTRAMLGTHAQFTGAALLKPLPRLTRSSEAGEKSL